MEGPCGLREEAERAGRGGTSGGRRSREPGAYGGRPDFRQRCPDLESRLLLALAAERWWRAAGARAARRAPPRVRLARGVPRRLHRDGRKALRFGLALARLGRPAPGGQLHGGRRLSNATRRSRPPRDRSVGAQLLRGLPQRAQEVPEGGRREPSELGLRRSELGRDSITRRPYGPRKRRGTSLTGRPRVPPPRRTRRSA